MLGRTHIALGILFCLLFFQGDKNLILFLAVCTVASLLPDIDSTHSKIGKHKIFRIFNFFMKHRGIVHSLVFLCLISCLVLVFYPIILFPFVLGYGLHLIADCLTLEGIRLFYPFKFRVKGFVKTGGLVENLAFILVVLLILFFLLKFLHIF